MIDIPERFLNVPYNGANFPGDAGATGLAGGANCQVFAYELLRHFGKTVPNFRSSNLWEDREFSTVATELEPLDLLLFNSTDDAYGAHVAVYLGDDHAIHLSHSVGKPAIWPISQSLALPQYRVLVGAKRILVNERVFQ